LVPAYATALLWTAAASTIAALYVAALVLPLPDVPPADVETTRGVLGGAALLASIGATARIVAATRLWCSAG
jgi:hypothetical protein